MPAWPPCQAQDLGHCSCSQAPALAEATPQTAAPCSPANAGGALLRQPAPAPQASCKPATRCHTQPTQGLSLQATQRTALQQQLTGRLPTRSCAGASAQHSWRSARTTHSTPRHARHTAACSSRAPCSSSSSCTTGNHCRSFCASACCAQLPWTSSRSNSNSSRSLSTSSCSSASSSRLQGCSARHSRSS